MSARSSDSEDDPPQLSEHAQAALQAFYSERAAQQQELQARLDQGAGPVHVQEDWQLSQFWYDDATAAVLAKEVLDGGRNKRIACVSCPTLYAKLVEMKPTDVQTYLLEYDKRFEVYGEDFVFYDYRQPLDLPEKLEKHSFDIVVADPPFLSEECLQRVAETISYLTRGKILLCTGEVMESSANRLLALKPCEFVPKHIRNLANEFRCYVNYNPAILNTSKV